MMMKKTRKMRSNWAVRTCWYCWLVVVRDRACSCHDLDDAIDAEVNLDGDAVVAAAVGEDEDEMAGPHVDDGVLVQSLDFVVPQPQRLVVGKSLRNSMIVVVAVGVVGIVTESYYC